MMKRLVLVDGYNLIKNDPTLSVIEARSLEAGRRALVSRMLTSFNLQANEVIVVFDGSDIPLPVPSDERHGQVRVVFSRKGETADAVILRMIAATPAARQLLLLSDDRELRDAAQAHGGIAGGAADRARPRTVPSRLAAKDSDERPRSTEKKGNPRRAKKRSRSAPIVRW
jgi:predicted RNA-binding protein with PIN domain